MLFFQLLMISYQKCRGTSIIPPDPALPPLRIATPPTAVKVLPPVGVGDGIAFEMLTFFI
jgi:hypothetical protein